jgi:hypothetical protein
MGDLRASVAQALSGPDIIYTHSIRKRHQHVQEHSLMGDLRASVARALSGPDIIYTLHTQTPSTCAGA